MLYAHNCQAVAEYRHGKLSGSNGHHHQSSMISFNVAENDVSDGAGEMMGLEDPRMGAHPVVSNITKTPAGDGEIRPALVEWSSDQPGQGPGFKELLCEFNSGEKIWSWPRVQRGGQEWFQSGREVHKAFRPRAFSLCTEPSSRTEGHQ